MTNRKNTRRALVLSLLSLLICCSMLVGTTFAWFTDSVTSGKNQIIAGNLDIELDYSKTMAEGTWASVEGQSDLIDPNALWEPGRTEVVYLRITNAGTLALKYNFAISVANSVIGKSVLGNDIALADYLKYSIIELAEGAEAFETREAARAEAEKNAKDLASYSDGTFMEPGDVRTVALVVYMPETVANEANYRGEAIPTIELGVNVLATQKDYESDSFGEDYDANASVAVNDIAELQAAIDAAEEGGTVFIASGNYTTTAQINIYKSVNIVGLGTVNINTTGAFRGHVFLVSNTSAAVDGMTVGMKNLNVDATGIPKAGIYLRNDVTLNLDTVTIENSAWDDIQIVNAETYADGSYSDGANATVNAKNVRAGKVSLMSLETNEAHFNYDTASTIGTIKKTSNPEQLYINGVNGGTPVTDVNYVSTQEEILEAIENATGDITLVLRDDITGDITLTQSESVNVVLDGDGHTFAGVILVDGKSATFKENTLTIRNINFEADSISADACIQLGNGVTTATRYTTNVTISNCTFDVPGAVGIKSYTGGDKNLTVIDCVATSACHSLIQAKGIDGILMEGCEAYSKNGLNFNNSTNVVISGCTVDTKGYAVRFGESSGGTGAAETYLIKDSSLKSANDDGDAVIILRGTADYSTLTIENTTLEGEPQITNTATGATVIK